LLEIITSNDLGQEDLTQWEMVLGIIDRENNNMLLLHPNPTTGQLRITNYELRIEKIEVFDIYGKKQKTESRRQNELDISHLPVGIYFLKIKTETGEATQKVIKQ
jgi:hypothetical protein